MYKSLWCKCKKPKYTGATYGETYGKNNSKERNYFVCDKCDKPRKETKYITKSYEGGLKCNA